MNLTLKRDVLTPQFTLGRLLDETGHLCFTCEDPVRQGEKVPGNTAIPYGRYKIIITRSNRFGRDLPLLLNVPLFVGIRIHPGNTALDTEGCILPGRVRTPTGVGESRLAFNELFELIEFAINSGEEVWIEITAA